MSLTYISGLTLSITQLTTFYRKMMSRGGGSGRGRPHKLPGVVAPSKVKRICGAEGCGVHVVGTELPHHYKARSDFKKLGQLRKMATEVAEEELKGLDPHTGVNKKQKKIKTVWHGFRGFLNLSGRVNQTNLKLSASFPNTVCWTSSTFFRVADCLI